jgi:membrane-bound serine protease (ClpP class)
MVHGLLWLFEAIYIAVVGILLLSILSGMSLYGVSGQVQGVLVVAVIVAAVMTALLLYKALQARFLKVRTGREVLIGARGEAVTDLRPKGEVRVMSEYWQAKSESEWISKGEKVEVMGMDGLFLIVKLLKEKV